jgi:hypothetical protein
MPRDIQFRLSARNPRSRSALIRRNGRWIVAIASSDTNRIQLLTASDPSLAPDLTIVTPCMHCLTPHFVQFWADDEGETTASFRLLNESQLNAKFIKED